MKKLLAIILALALALSFVACGATGEKSSGETDKKGWPSVPYLKDTDKYTGKGSIVNVKEWDASGNNEMWSVYYEGADFESAEAYVAALVSAGWVNHYADDDGNYMENKTDRGTARAYYCTCDYAEAEIIVADYSNTMSFTDSPEFFYNLSIEFSRP